MIVLDTHVWGGGSTAIRACGQKFEIKSTPIWIFGFAASLFWKSPPRYLCVGLYFAPRLTGGLIWRARHFQWTHSRHHHVWHQFDFRANSIAILPTA